MLTDCHKPCRQLRVSSGPGRLRSSMHTRAAHSKLHLNRLINTYIIHTHIHIYLYTHRYKLYAICLHIPGHEQLQGITATRNDNKQLWGF